MSSNDNVKQLISDARRLQRERENSYRERALKLFPWICAHCGRDFDGKRLRELTVHHKDHNHQNNPPDGSNWELLCIYCHDNEHSREEVADAYEPEVPTNASAQVRGKSGKSSKNDFVDNPFAGLSDLLKGKQTE